MVSLDQSEAEAERALTDLKFVLAAAAESRGVSANVDHLKLEPPQPGSPELFDVPGLMLKIDSVATGLKLKKRSNEQKEIDELKAVLIVLAGQVRAGRCAFCGGRMQADGRGIPSPARQWRHDGLHRH